MLDLRDIYKDYKSYLNKDIDLSVDWSTEYENPEYIGCEFGKKKRKVS